MNNYYRGNLIKIKYRDTIGYQMCNREIYKDHYNAIKEITKKLRCKTSLQYLPLQRLGQYVHFQ